MHNPLRFVFMSPDRIGAIRQRPLRRRPPITGARGGLLVLLASLLFGGCAQQSEYIAIVYHPESPVTCLRTAEGLPIRVIVRDNRDVRDKVGGQYDRNGREVAVVRSTMSVRGLLEDLIDDMLTQRGFELRAEGVPVVVNLWVFYNQFKGIEGALGVSRAVAEVTFDVNVYAAGHPAVGEPRYYKHIQGEGITDSVAFWSVENAKVALEAALADAIKRLCADEGLLDTLIVAGRQRPTSSVKTRSPVGP
jgi:uncharacterized lipoprotein YajG